MKTLKLELKERLFIVELPENADINEPIQLLNYKGYSHIVYSQNNVNIISRNRLPDGKYELICKGSELTEQVAKGLVKNMIDNSEVHFLYQNYRYAEKSFLDTALQSFISSIEAQGYYWGENPYKHPYTQIEIYGNNSPETTTNYHNDLEKFQKAESLTFNPDKTIIFKI